MVLFGPFNTRFIYSFSQQTLLLSFKGQRVAIWISLGHLRVLIETVRAAAPVKLRGNRDLTAALRLMHPHY